MYLCVKSSQKLVLSTVKVGDFPISETPF